MTTYNASIYHCISCGRVVHAEPGAPIPQCCGHTMAEACKETIHQGQQAGEAADVGFETKPSVVEGRKKAR